jgi:hypothetical protein
MARFADFHAVGPKVQADPLSRVDVGDSDPLAEGFVADGDFHTGQTAVGDGISNSE